MQALETAVELQRLDRLIAGAQHRGVASRGAQPALHQAAAHATGADIEQVEQAFIAFAAGVDLQLQIAPAVRVDAQQRAGLLQAQAGDVRQLLFLSVAQVLQQRAGGCDGGAAAIATKAFEIADSELIEHQLAGAAQLEMPVRTAAYGRQTGQGRRFAGIADQQFCGRGRGQILMQGVGRIELGDDKTPAGQIQARDAVGVAHAGDRAQSAFAASIQQGFIGDRARCHHPHDLALHRALGAGVAELFGNRHRLAQAQQARQILLVGMVRHAGHGDRLAGRLAARGQGDVE